MAPALSFRPERWSAEALELLAAAQAHDTTGGMESVRDYALNNLPLVVGRDRAGELRAAYCATWHPMVKNLHVAVAAARCATGVDRTAELLADLELRAHALEADWLSCTTRRPGLTRKLTRSGFGVHGVILRKLMRAAT